MVMRAGLLSTSGVFQEPPGGSLIVMFSTRPERVRWVVPAEVNVVAFRRSPPLLGFGLLEAIPDATLEALAAQSGKPAGVLGRVGHVTDAVSQQTRAGRFGWKAQHATLRAFAGDAYRSEMGITNEVFPEELAPNGDLAALALVDYVADPESEFGAVSKLTDFMRLLDAPARGPIGASEVAGELLFTQAGCASCHVPSITTGPSEIAALSFREARLFSDLLLHDVGTGDGIAQADASPSEMRTMPLWGLRHRTPYLHDGRAATIDAAIRLHAGEAAGVTAAYAALSVAERDQLVTFLRSL